MICSIGYHFQHFRPYSLRNESTHSRHYSEQKNTPRVVNLESGLVLIKHGLPPIAEIATSLAVMQRGVDPKKGFWRVDENGKKVLNSRPYRGRFYDALDQFPPFLSEFCVRNLKLASASDPTIHVIKPTHCIALAYYPMEQPPAEGYIPWHRDNGENDGEGTTPVVSFTLGDSCDFLLSHEKPKVTSQHPRSNPANLAHRILFESGDVLIFGGPCRYIWHSIYHIHSNTAPDYSLLKKGRFNLTFRFTPHLRGREEEFITVPAEQLSKDNRFYKLSKM